VFVIVILGLLNLLIQSSRVVEETLKLRQRDRLKKHTSKLTPKGVILEHVHDASVDLFTDLLLLDVLSRGFGRASSCRNRLLNHELRLRLGLLHLNGHGSGLRLLHLALSLLATGTTTLVLT